MHYSTRHGISINTPYTAPTTSYTPCCYPYQTSKERRILYRSHIQHSPYAHHFTMKAHIRASIKHIKQTYILFTVMQYSLFAFARDLKEDFFDFSVLRGLTRRPPTLSIPPQGAPCTHWKQDAFTELLNKITFLLHFQAPISMPWPCCLCIMPGLFQSSGSSAYFSAIFTADSSVMPCFGCITSSC